MITMRGQEEKEKYMDSKGQSLVAAVQMRRQLKQSEGTADSHLMTGKTLESGTLNRTVAHERNRKAWKYASPSVASVNDLCLINVS